MAAFSLVYGQVATKCFRVFWAMSARQILTITLSVRCEENKAVGRSVIAPVMAFSKRSWSLRTSLRTSRPDADASLPIPHLILSQFDPNTPLQSISKHYHDLPIIDQHRRRSWPSRHGQEDPSIAHVLRIFFLLCFIVYYFKC